MDENDNIPTFTNSESTITIDDEIQLAEVLLKINAIDLDFGPNSRIRYKLISDKSGSMDLNPYSGELIFAR